MSVKDIFRNYPFIFILFYALVYMGNAVYGTFIPLYLDHLGFSKTIVGTLLSLGPFIAIIAQPVWGMAGDRASAKNNVLKILLLGCALTVLAYPVSTSIYYLFTIIAIFTFFQTPVVPLGDAITLEYIELTQWKFGPIRMAGTIGYALMSIAAGAAARHNINNIFPLYFAITLLTLAAVFKLPIVKGHQSGGRKMAVWKLFHNRELVVLMSLNLIAMITLGFYYSFFSIYYKQLGGDSALLGWGMFISAASEIPFLLFADRIIRRLGSKGTLIMSILVMAIRWFLLYAVTDVYVILGMNILHGLSFIVMAYSMVTYINKNVPKELRASGQTMNGLIGMGLARIAGSIFGGFLSDMVGTQKVFLYASILNFTAVAVFGTVFLIQDRKKAKVKQF